RRDARHRQRLGPAPRSRARVRRGVVVAMRHPMLSARPQIAAFTYHEVTDDPSSSGFQRLGAVPYKLTPRAFAEHLAWIAAGPVAPTRVTSLDFTRPGRFLVLTFDDGGKSALYAGDELCRRGWPGHFFVVCSLVGGRTFMLAGDSRHLVSCRHLVGTHSLTLTVISRT